MYIVGPVLMMRAVSGTEFDGHQVDFRLHTPLEGRPRLWILGFRQPKAIVEREVARLVAHGVVIESSAIIGKTHCETLPELRNRFDAVFSAVGAGLPIFSASRVRTSWASTRRTTT